jgi:YNFM family putative membrane transporter
MLHNTLQTNATQMTPQARGTAVGLFSSALYVGQTAGVAAGAVVIDRAGAPPLFPATAIALPVLASAGIETIPAGGLTPRRKNLVTL